MKPTTLITLLALASTTHAQWSSDPAANLALADRSGEQTQPKIVPSGDGGFYVSWYDNSTGGYDVVLQRLDASGVEQWAHDGVVVADRGFSSTQDYGLAVDSAGNALLTFRDDRFTGTQITAAKVDGTGALVWGANGVQLTSTTAFVAAPKIAGTTGGDVVVAWTQDSDVLLQKLDASGVPQWGGGVTLSEPGGGNFSASDMHASGAGSVIISCIGESGGFGSPRHIFAQKLDGTGAEQWGANHVAVFDGGSIQFGNFPTFVPDGSGGAVFPWYETSPLQCRVQRVLSNGTEAFAHDGVTVSTDATRIRVSPAADFDSATSELFVFWTEQNAVQSMSGVYGQKLDASGARQWGTQGKVLVPLGANSLTQVRTLNEGDGAFVFWNTSTGFNADTLQAARVDTNGDFTFGPLTASSLVSGKSRLAVAPNTTADYAALVWVDSRNDAGDIYAQDVTSNGTLGPVGIPLLSGGLLALFAVLLAGFGARQLRRTARTTATRAD